MITRTRFVAAMLSALLLAGPLAPLASGQQAPQSPTPELEETLKAERDAERMRGAYEAGAVAVNVFLVPGRAITCFLGGVVSVAVLAATLGTAYRAASDVMHEGCGGRWTVTGDDLRPAPTTRMAPTESPY